MLVEPWDGLLLESSLMDEAAQSLGLAAWPEPWDQDKWVEANLPHLKSWAAQPDVIARTEAIRQAHADYLQQEAASQAATKVRQAAERARGVGVGFGVSNEDHGSYRAGDWD
jgi:hypothetical protein